MFLLNYKIFYLFLMLFISGILKFCMNYKFLLINLLTLEYIMLSLFLLLFIYLNFFLFEMFFLMIFLTFSVCEGVIGISLLIAMVRNYENNYFQSLLMFLC